MTNENRIFYVTVRHMPTGHTYTQPVLAKTLEEAKQKAVEWSYHRAPGAYEYLTLA
jgi:gamma-glutamyltranspeptidase